MKPTKYFISFYFNIAGESEGYGNTDIELSSPIDDFKDIKMIRDRIKKDTNADVVSILNIIPLESL